MPNSEVVAAQVAWVDVALVRVFGMGGQPTSIQRGVAIRVAFKGEAGQNVDGFGLPQQCTGLYLHPLAVTGEHCPIEASQQHAAGRPAELVP